MCPTGNFNTFPTIIRFNLHRLSLPPPSLSSVSLCLSLLLCYTRNWTKDEELDDLNENEINDFIVDDEEYKLKKILWEVIFKEWIDEQKNKETIEKMTSKKRVRKSSKAESTIATNPIEAIKNSSKFKKNINMGVIENLFSPKAIL